MGIICDGMKKKLCQSQEKYIEKVLDMFNMKDAKLVDTPLAPIIIIPSNKRVITPSNNRVIIPSNNRVVDIFPVVFLSILLRFFRNFWCCGFLIIAYFYFYFVYQKYYIFCYFF